MKIICSQIELSNALLTASRAVPSRPTHPILANILLRADKETNRITLTSFDLSLGICSSFIGEVLEGGEIAIPSKLLVDIASKLPNGEITLSAIAEGEGFTFTLKPKKGKYQVRAMSAEEFPELPVIESDSPIKIKIPLLLEGLKGTLFACSSDESKQVLTGVHLTLTQDYLEFGATDGHRLSVINLENEDNDKEINVTVPARALRELQKMLTPYAKSDELVEMYLDEGQVVFSWENQKLSSRTLEGQYPFYNQLIPKVFERQLTIERKQLIGILERIGILADQKNNVVKMSINSDDQEITLSCEAQDVGSGVESIPAQISGDNIDIAFNVKYLMEGLKELNSSEIQMFANQSLTPVVFRPLSGLKMTYLAMPVQLRD